MDSEFFRHFSEEEGSEFHGTQEPQVRYDTDLATNDLVAWRNAVDLAVIVYDVTKHWPRSESYRLTDQACRAAVSIAANIAEGQGRASKKDFLRFLFIALGSQRELETHLIIARRIGLLDEESFSRVSQACMNSRKPLRGLINHLSHDGDPMSSSSVSKSLDPGPWTLDPIPEYAEAVVIGAGAFGLGTGYALAKHGLSNVLVLDQFEPGTQTSSRAAGFSRTFRRTKPRRS